MACASKEPLRPPAGRRRAKSKAGRRTNNRVEELARSLGQLGARENLDIRSEVYGVTHRGTVRIKLTHIESLTDTMLDQWRCLCAAQGYAPKVTFDASTNEAEVSCTPIPTQGWACERCASWRKTLPSRCTPPHLSASTLVFLCMFVCNVVRHLLL